MQALEHEHRLAARERETLAETTAKLQAREQELRNREETFRRRLEERIEERLRDARREIDAVVDALKARTDALAADAERRMAPRLIPTGETGAARAEARAAIEAIGERLRDARWTARRRRPRPRRPSRAGAAAVGDRVLVGAFGLEGVVQALHDREAEVDVRGKRLRARVDELRVLTPAAADSAHTRVASTSTWSCSRAKDLLTELNVIGCHVDEALSPDRKIPRRSAASAS